VEIKGKIAVITGAGSGIGQAAAMELAGRDVRALALADMSNSVEAVAASINNAEAAEAVCEQLRQKAVRAKAYQADVSVSE
jgi:NAD(P)-dependent dehydrogenase (short-subunit alcohol dehydrogenase family)